MVFNGIYMNATRNPHNGANEVDVLAKVCQIYKEKASKTFANETFWGVVKNKPKWLALKSADDFTGISKRTRTSEPTHNQSSDVYIVIDLNNEYPYKAPIRPMR